MRKHLFLFTLAASFSLAVQAQGGAAQGVQRDPNPPYGAAAGVPAQGTAGRAAGSVQPAVNANQPGAANTAASANGPAAAGTAGATARASGPQPSSGASSTPGTTQGAPAERPGAAIASRGSTTATGGNAAPYDPGSTPGWTMMTPQEQQSYSGRMSSFTSVAQCRAYQAAYLAQIQERARRMGQIVQPQENDPCTALQQQGALK